MYLLKQACEWNFCLLSRRINNPQSEYHVVQHYHYQAGNAQYQGALAYCFGRMKQQLCVSQKGINGLVQGKKPSNFPLMSQHWGSLLTNNRGLLQGEPQSVEHFGALGSSKKTQTINGFQRYHEALKLKRKELHGRYCCPVIFYFFFRSRTLFFWCQSVEWHKRKYQGRAEVHPQTHCVQPVSVAAVLSKVASRLTFYGEYHALAPSKTLSAECHLFACFIPYLVGY